MSLMIQSPMNETEVCTAADASVMAKLQDRSALLQRELAEAKEIIREQSMTNLTQGRLLAAAKDDVSRTKQRADELETKNDMLSRTARKLREQIQQNGNDFINWPLISSSGTLGEAKHFNITIVG